MIGMKKNIGITQRIGTDKNGTTYEYLEKDYVEYYSKYFDLIPISNFVKDLPSYLKKFKIKGFILTGGNNINPNLYGSNETKDDVSNVRDKKERDILDYAISNKLPVLGTCRGCQLINLYFKGKLIGVDKNDHVAKGHSVILDDGKIIDVNSYHQYGFTEKELGENLDVFAKFGDEIEGIRHKKYPILGIIWHPERKNIKQDDKFNEELINALFDI